MKPRRSLTPDEHLSVVAVMTCAEEDKALRIRPTPAPSMERVLEIIRRHRKALLETPSVDEVKFELEFFRGGVSKFWIEVLYQYQFIAGDREDGATRIIRAHLQEAGRDAGVANLKFHEDRHGRLTARYRFLENTGAV